MAASSVTRTFTTVKAVYNFASAEWGLELKNPFANVYFDRTKGVSKRLPISVENIRKVQAECRRMDDDLRWSPLSGGWPQSLYQVPHEWTGRAD